MGLTPPPLPLHRPLETQSPLSLPPRLPVRAAPALPARAPRILDNHRRLPPAPAARPSMQEPPVRNNVGSVNPGEYLLLRDVMIILIYPCLE